MVRTMRRRIRPAVAVFAAGVVAIAVIAEVSLQLAAALSSDRSGSASDGTASFRILALGDSHTYGARVENEESYPSQLQSFLDKHSPATFYVINKGIPGFTTAQVRSRLAQQVNAYDPHLVLLWAGINDTWNVTEIYGDKISWRERIDGYASRLRLYKMWRVWRHDRQLEREFPLLIGDDDGPRPHVEVLGEHGRRIDWGNGVVEEIRTESRERRSDTIHARRVEANFDAIVTWLRAAGICVAFIEYPVDAKGFGNANISMRAVALRYKLPIVRSKESIRRVPADQLEFLWAMHPNAAMYGEIASDVAEAVLEMEERCR